MRLFEAILDANHRALEGDRRAGIHPDDFAESLPVVALTCVDPRLNPLLPEVLGLPEAQFIWLRNAGNVITGPRSSTVRSISLACALKGGREIAVIGHTDCAVGKASVSLLTDRFQALGIPRDALPENLREFFGLFASENQNVQRGVDILRQSPLLGPHVPLHGLMVDVLTGRLEWVVNGYDYSPSLASEPKTHPQPGPASSIGTGSFGGFHLGEMAFPDFQIGTAAAAPVPPPAEPSRRPAPASLPEAEADPQAPQAIPTPPRIPPVVRLHQPWKKR